MQKAYVSLSRGQMHYRYAGEGTPVICLHMSGSSSDEYDKAGDLLAENFNVYAPDFYGMGNSDITYPESVQYLSIDEHMETIKEFCDVLALRSVIVIGNLVGANIACRLAATYPLLVKRLVLFQVCYNSDPDYYKNLRHSAGFAQIPLSGDGSHLMEIWARSAKYGESAAVTDARAACLHQAGLLGEILHWALCDDLTFGQCLPMISCSSKIYAYDFMNTATAAQAAALIPGCQFEVLEQCTPYFSRANPLMFCEKVRSFLEA